MIRLYDFDEVRPEEILNRDIRAEADVEATVDAIIADVRARGDAALIEYAAKFDHAELTDVRVSQEEIDEAFAELEKTDPEFITTLKMAAENIRHFHEQQLHKNFVVNDRPGIVLGQKYTPIQRAGVYVPGGTAAYPSTVLMDVIPAKVAGVDEIYKSGGAQAIAAMALGTESIEPVQKIVGPGNVFVTGAKMMLRNTVDIDFPAGPSEIGVLADETAVPEYVASDLIAQAEHDPSSASLLVTSDPDLPDRIWEIMEGMIEKAPRREIIEKAINNSGYIIAEDMDLAIEIMNGIAPEHLSIQVRDPLDVLGKVRNGGSIFVGPYTPVAAGDYASGTNHVLPTSGHASTCSGLNIHHFMKTSTVQMLSKEGLAVLAPTIETLATAEGLHAHCESVKIRKPEEE